MKAFLFLALVALVVCQRPRPPAPKKMTCKSAIAKICPKETGRTCLQCVEKNFRKIKENSDCTRKTLEAACGITPGNHTMGCEKALKADCGMVMHKGDMCFNCTDSKRAKLDAAGCTNHAIQAYCRGKNTTNNCGPALAKVCGNLQHKGAMCVNCTHQHASMLRDAGCNLFREEQFCHKGGIPNPPSAMGCNKTMAGICGMEKGKGAACYKCLFAHYANVTAAGCTGKDLHAYCGSGHQGHSCEPALTRYCGAYAGQHYYCFQCVVSNTDALKAAGCTNRNYDQFCESHVGSNCTRTLEKECRGDRKEGPKCDKCVKAHKPTLDAAGCELSDYNKFCDRRRVPGHRIPGHRVPGRHGHGGHGHGGRTPSVRHAHGSRPELVEEQ
eukprot:TRINITY_DN60156_c0_g2_i1.p1 TRINITY_DN60156_c0_g2~~TRINITY_DN60156_c0_g2_i1.p1  ORF type:complete len:384 (-),score=61.40 TRINITY_DN60156_c0_g2_i1:200-1351(-)